MMEDEDLDLEYRVTWHGPKGGKTGRVRSTLKGAREVWTAQAARKSAELQLQVREVPDWNEPMDTEDAIELLGLSLPVPNWASMSAEDQHLRAWGRTCQFPGLDPESVEGRVFYEHCRSEMAAGRDLPTWSPS